MGCAGAGAALKGEREVKMANERTAMDGVLDRVAGLSKGLQRRKAERQMKRDQRGSPKDQAMYREPEEEAAEADWWSGGGGGATAEAPSYGSNPFDPIEEDEDEDEDDYDYNDSDWDAYEYGGGEGAKYDGVDYGREDVGGDGPSLVLCSNTLPVTASRASGQSVGKTKKGASKDSSDSDDAPAPKGGKGSKGGGKGRPQSKGGSANAWADDSDSDAPPAKLKAKSLPKRPTSSSSSDSEGRRARDKAATKIQAAQRGKAARNQEQGNRASPPGPASKQSPAKQSKAKDAWDDSGSSDNGVPSRAAPPKGARGPSKPRGQPKQGRGQQAPLLSKRETSDSSDLSSIAASPNNRRASGRPKGKAKGKPKPKGRPPGGQARPPLESSDSDDGGKVMF